MGQRPDPAEAPIEGDIAVDGDAAGDPHRAGGRRGHRERVEDGHPLGELDGAHHRAAGDEEEADERGGEARGHGYQTGSGAWRSSKAEHPSVPVATARRPAAAAR